MNEHDAAKPTFGLHWWAAAVVAAALVFLNLDGYHNGFGLKESGRFFGEPPAINWTHGWPVFFYVRTSIYPLAVGKGGPLPRSFTGEFGTYSRWPVDEAPAIMFSIAALVIDLIACLFLLAGTAFGVRQMLLRYGRSMRLQFGLRVLFALTTIVAVALAFGLPAFIPRHVLQFFAFGIVGMGMFAVLAACGITMADRLRRGLVRCT